MPGDDKIYGFNREDSIELINLIGNHDHEFAELEPRDYGGGSKLMAGRLTEDWVSRQATAEVYSLNGLSVVYVETAELYDPLEVFASLGSGDWLYITKQSGKYYAPPNANCAGTSPLISSPPATQPGVGEEPEVNP